MTFQNQKKRLDQKGIEYFTELKVSEPQLMTSRQ